MLLVVIIGPGGLPPSENPLVSGYGGLGGARTFFWIHVRTHRETVRTTALGARTQSSKLNRESEPKTFVRRHVHLHI